MPSRRRNVPALNEFEIIRRFFTYPARGAVLGVGDDAALTRVRRGMELVISADMLVAGRHFRADADPERLGHKALAVNLSDMAAMGATPRWATLAVALPRVQAGWLAAFMRGFMRLARRHGVDLVGGDTTRGPLNICVQIMGEVPRGRALRRDGSRAGDDVWVSGALGDAALALRASRGRVRVAPRERRELERKLDAPAPRVALGMALRGVARSAIDISDGLVADLGHICERSRVSALIEFERIPASAIMRRHLERSTGRTALLAGGDDYELCFSASRAGREAIARMARRLRLKLTRIGKIIPRRRGASLVTVLDSSGRPIAVGQTGYKHF
jgi:thiamine-monophosphate kinase